MDAMTTVVALLSVGLCAVGAFKLKAVGPGGGLAALTGGAGLVGLAALWGDLADRDGSPEAQLGVARTAWVLVSVVCLAAAVVAALAWRRHSSED